MSLRLSVIGARIPEEKEEEHPPFLLCQQEEEMKEISSGFWPGGQWTINLCNSFISQGAGFSKGPSRNPVTQQIHESICGCDPPPPQTASVEFGGPERACGDFLTAINYSDDSHDARKRRGAQYPNTMVQSPTYQTPFHMVVYQTEPVKREAR